MSFDGQYKRGPVVSLGGASKRQEKASTLIQRVQEERQRREATRKKNASALQIQSFVRGSLVRHQQYANQRAAFDTAKMLFESNTNQEPDVTTVTHLIRRLLFFYSVSEDTPRLIWMCQLLLKHRSIMRKLQEHEPLRCMYHLKHLLLLCCRSLDASLEESNPVAVQMRMLEVFTGQEAYITDSEEPASGDSKRFAMSVVIFLIRNGYFQYLRSLINLKIPSSLEYSSAPPTPLAGAIRDLVIRPVHMVCRECDVGTAGFNVTEERHETLAALTSELLCKQMPDQITCFLLPALAHPGTRFPFGSLVETLLQCHSLRITGKAGAHQVHATPWLLYAVMVFAESLIDSLTDAQLVSYIRVLHFLLPQLPGRGSRQSHGVDSDESDSDEEVPVQQDLLSIRERCLSVLDSRPHVKRLEALVLGTMDSQSDRMEWQGSKQVMSSLCFLCHFLMSECKLPVPKTRLLFTLALNRSFVRHLWQHTKSVCTTTTLGKEIPLLQVVSQGIGLSAGEAEQIVHVLALFCSLLHYTLFSIHDAEFYGEGGKGCSMPFNIQELVTISSILRDVAIGVTGIIYPDSQPHLSEHYSAAMRSVGARAAAMETATYYPQLAWIKLLKNITSLVKQLHQRDARRPFCPEGHWLSHKVCIDPMQVRIDGFFPSDDAQSVEEGAVHTGMSYTAARHMSILQHIPFVVPFKDRVKLLQRILSRDRQESQGDLHQFMMGPAIDISVNRNHIYQDAFDQLAQDKVPNLKQRVRVRIINFQGLEEAGVDGGGLFREFLNELLKVGFDANIGFFRYSNEGLLYPNPQASILTSDYLKHYHFLGRMLGKALYENMLVELPFASFFLCKLLSKFGTDLDIHHLESLDPEMYRNLLFLKSYDGNVEDLALNFTVVNNDLGENQVVELKPGGRDIPVTNSNRISYIHLVADYRLNRQIRTHCQAFRAGLSDVIDLDWLRMFDHNELQVLISGAPVPVDIEDLKRNTNYSGGFSVDHPCIQAFWAAVSSFSDEQKRQLLKFVTSCSRPPLLGFKELYPPFCVHSAGRENRLPSASTCMNLLKLPEFQDEQTMKERLLYAVESEAGFELS